MTSSLRIECVWLGHDIEGGHKGWVAQAYLDAGSHEPIGELTVRPTDTPGVLFITFVGVTARFRGQGVATALFEYVRAVELAGTRFTAIAQTPEGRVFLESLQRSHPDLVSFTPQPESMGAPEPCEHYDSDAAPSGEWAKLH